MGRLSRRQFLKITAGTFGAAGAAAPRSRCRRPAAGLRRRHRRHRRHDDRTDVLRDVLLGSAAASRTSATAGCGSFEGNPRDPQSRGRLCPRGTGAVGAVYDPDRLRQPLIRTGERGKEQWKTATWDEALDHIATKMKKIAAEHGPESIALFSHGTGGGFIRQATRAFGCVNQTLPSFAQCKGPATSAGS